LITYIDSAATGKNISLSTPEFAILTEKIIAAWHIPVGVGAYYQTRKRRSLKITA
jgi:hypothetical protein